MTSAHWPRSIVPREGWEQAAVRLQAGELALLGLWAEPARAHMAVLEIATNACAVLAIECEANRFPSVGRLHPPAIRPERAIRDLVGLEPVGLPDSRPWLRHDRAYPFLPGEGD